MKSTICGLALLTLVGPLATVGLWGGEPQRPDTRRYARATITTPTRTRTTPAPRRTDGQSVIDLPARRTA